MQFSQESEVSFCILTSHLPHLDRPDILSLWKAFHVFADGILHPLTFLKAFAPLTDDTAVMHEDRAAIFLGDETEASVFTP